MDTVKDIIAWIGTAIGIGLNITPAVLFYKIFRKIENYKIVPESMMVFSSANAIAENTVAIIMTAKIMHKTFLKNFNIFPSLKTLSSPIFDSTQ